MMINIFHSISKLFYIKFIHGFERLVENHNCSFDGDRKLVTFLTNPKSPGCISVSK